MAGGGEVFDHRIVLKSKLGGVLTVIKVTVKNTPYQQRFMLVFQYFYCLYEM